MANAEKVAATTTKKSVAKKADTSTAVATVDDLDLLESLAAEESARTDIRMEDLKTPFLKIVQTMSQDIKALVPAARDGQLFNTVTRELFDIAVTPVELVPIHYEVEVVEWSDDRKLVARHHRDTELLDKAKKDSEGKLKLPNGNQLVKTAYWLVVMNDVPAILSLKSTGLTASSEWLSLIDNQKFVNKAGKKQPYPKYFFKYLLKSKTKTNKKGNFFTADFTLGERITDLETIQHYAQMAKRAGKVLKEAQSTETADTPEEMKVDTSEGGVI